MKTPDSEQPAGDDAWDDLFRQRLADYTDQPPADALNRILTVANPPRPFRYRWVVGAVALLLLLGTGSWLGIQSLTKSELVRVADRLPPVPMPSMVRQSATDNTSEQAGRETGLSRPPDVRSTTKTVDHPINPGLPVNRDESVADAVPDRRMATRVTDKATSAGAISSANLGRTGLAMRTERAAALPSAAINPAPNRVGEQTRLGVYPQNRLRNGPPLPVAEYDYKASVRQPAVPDASVLSITAQQQFDLISGRPFQAFNVTHQLPAISVVSAASQTPEASRQRRRPAWFVSLTPLYNFQQIDPIHTDEEFVSNIQGARPLDTDRLSGRLQLGLEWSLTRRLSLRTSLVYQQMRQSLRYAVRSTRPDSVQIVLVTDQSVRVTPHFTERTYAESTVWHYAGLSSDLVWQLNRGGQWQHYLTAGLTAGRYLGAQQAVSGFGQVSYGFERPLTTTVRLRIEPSLQLGWQALTDQAQRLQSRPYSYGLLLGLRFR